ncbi:GHKL domain-containing protein [Paenibacillus sonchi]|uniref:GHKL domain-containing protein n=1 Tax=Paenibacillus sonchi TaxID=373687 RepID=A0A974PGW8_9BACL|nr:GHKL domain-containing protein [Paenibacillus sonchi]
MLYIYPVSRKIFRSTKSNHKAHGIGLKNIKKTIAELNGLLDISYDHHFFRARKTFYKLKRTCRRFLIGTS